MKFAAYTEDSIWAVEDTEAAAMEEAQATIKDVGEAVSFADLKIAPIDDNLVAALEEAETNGGQVFFELIDGELCEVEPEA